MAIFLYFIYKEKWPKMGLKIAIKWPKMLQMSWNFDQTCISMSFIKFQKIFEKFSKLADFWPKNGHFARFARRDFETFFSTEIVSGPSKMLRLGWKSVYLLPIMCLTKVTYFCWIILSFGDFICVQSCREGWFLLKLAKNDQKWPTPQLWTHIKSPKLKIIQQK